MRNASYCMIFEISCVQRYPFIYYAHQCLSIYSVLALLMTVQSMRSFAILECVVIDL